ncbi:general substrate transporter [Aspergillus pseudonomiae]|uniref:General substrate transporter n=1 Tax=Aspergillus pseudonomiae TaxID=1506151 RepID=A0A5N7DUP2_9EURO|nr:general substrate transporter [Aspergillus pseudonomiae]KAB8261349.1 general substrate transporter [Aspergillus pseudonomiae]KAE8410086.1 general substrate transporter [Aspergillus pseudonomiae]
MSSIDLDKRKDGPIVEHDEDAIPGLHYQTVDPHADPDAISYGPNGVKGLFFSKYVFGAATLASLGGFSMGYDMGVISIINVMEPFHKAFPKAETSFGKGLMTGMLLLGAFIGCIFMSYLSDRISRKWAITAMVVAFDIGAILQTAAVNYDMLVAGRFIGGIGVGTLAMGAPLYISEVSPPNMRGTLLVLESISISAGVVIAYWITFGTRHMAGEACFRLPFGLQMVSATALGLGIHFFPYSPRWLALVNRDAECLTSLTKLRNLPATDERVQIEYNSIISEVRFQKIVQERKHPGAKGLKLEILSWFDLFSKGTWRRTAVGCGIAFFQQFSGINAFIYYAPTLFESLGQSSEMSLILSGVFNVLQLVAAIICFLLIEKIGRRPLAIGGAFGMAAAYVIIAVLSGVYSKDWQANMAAGWACVAMAFVFILLYGVSYSPLGWALPSEVFSTTSRSKGVALSTCVIWLSDFIIGLITPSMLAEIEYRTYIFFAVMCFVAGIWAFLLVPETSGKSLEEIDELFGDDSAKKEREIAAAALGSSPERSVMTV